MGGVAHRCTPDRELDLGWVDEGLEVAGLGGLNVRRSGRRCDEAQPPWWRLWIDHIATLVDRHMMVVPAQGHEVGGVGWASVGPVLAMMDLESVSTRTSGGRTTVVPPDYELPESGWNSCCASSGIEWFTVGGDADGFDGATTEDLFERSSSDDGSGGDGADDWSRLGGIHEYGDTRLLGDLPRLVSRAIGFCCARGLGVLTDGDQGISAGS